MASEIPVKFTDGTYNIPGCYYEFAKRYKMDNGKFYQGFVAKSADKIFESTNKQK
jgi:glutamine cyclotransferase